MTLKYPPWGDFPDFEWDDFNEAELWKHQVSPKEVVQCFRNSDLEVSPYNRKAKVRFDPERYANRYTVIGITDGGRKLKIFVDYIGDDCILAAGCMVVDNMQIPEKSIVMGVPARIRGEVSDEQMARNKWFNDVYLELTERYINDGELGSEIQ